MFWFLTLLKRKIKHIFHNNINFTLLEEHFIQKLTLFVIQYPTIADRRLQMLKISLIFLGICVSIHSALANEEAVISLFEGTSEAAAPSKPAEEDKDSLFSFLNFKMPEKIFSDSEEKKPATIEDTIKLADKGNLQAQLILGYSYLYGENGLTPNYDKAFEYYGKAALQNDPTGLNNLGSLYYGGIGVSRNPIKAAILFEKAAELGNPEAAVNIGFMYASGNGAKQDIKKAIDYFEKASEFDNPAAKFMTGYAYYRGVARPIDYIKAAPLIKFAADAGFDEAQFVLADIYINGRGFPQNYNNAVKYLRLSSSQGNTEAMMTLADILAIGQRYNKDLDFAHVLYNLASVRGVAEASTRRQAVESKMKINEILQAQINAENFQEKINPLTNYIRQTFGNNIRAFMQ
ncbi:MAG: sel1 repeat family protein [Alphaproteobacteria bacterium]|nr:sel1 repeat family protein [Alphaproteobacteria bacterium]